MEKKEMSMYKTLMYIVLGSSLLSFNIQSKGSMSTSLMMASGAALMYAAAPDSPPKKESPHAFKNAYHHLYQDKAVFNCYADYDRHNVNHTKQFKCMETGIKNNRAKYWVSDFPKHAELKHGEIFNKIHKYTDCTYDRELGYVRDDRDRLLYTYYSCDIDSRVEHNAFEKAEEARSNTDIIVLGILGILITILIILVFMIATQKSEDETNYEPLRRGYK